MQANNSSHNFLLSLLLLSMNSISIAVHMRVTYPNIYGTSKICSAIAFKSTVDNNQPSMVLEARWVIGKPAHHGYHLELQNDFKNWPDSTPCALLHAQ